MAWIVGSIWISSKVKKTNDYQIYSHCINYYNLGDLTITNILKRITIIEIYSNSKINLIYANIAWNNFDSHSSPQLFCFWKEEIIYQTNKYLKVCNALDLYSCIIFNHFFSSFNLLLYTFFHRWKKWNLIWIF